MMKISTVMAQSTAQAKILRWDLKSALHKWMSVGEQTIDCIMIAQVCTQNHHTLVPSTAPPKLFLLQSLQFPTNDLSVSISFSHIRQSTATAASTITATLSLCVSTSLPHTASVQDMLESGPTGCELMPHTHLLFWLDSSSSKMSIFSAAGQKLPRLLWWDYGDYCVAHAASDE